MNTNQFIICAVLVAILVAAVYAFIKTPPAQRWALSRPPEEKKEGVEYAPMYSKSERLRLVTFHFCWLIPAFIIYQYYFLPKFREFMAHAECIEIASTKGMEIIFFGLFVGFPLLTAVIIFIVQGLRAIRAFKAGQYPPPNEKVFQQTAYKYGVKAKLFAAAPFVLIFFLVGFSIWGGYQANILVKQTKTCQSQTHSMGLN